MWDRGGLLSRQTPTPRRGPGNQRFERKRLINAASGARSCWCTAVNLIPSPLPGVICWIAASARICPSFTRKCSCVFSPLASGRCVSRNNPPIPKLRKRDKSLRWLHSQYTHTSIVASTRLDSLRDGEVPNRKRGPCGVSSANVNQSPKQRVYWQTALFVSMPCCENVAEK